MRSALPSKHVWANRNVLLGALVMHRLEHGRDAFSRGLQDWLCRELPGFLTRDNDKLLFADLMDAAPVKAGQDVTDEKASA